LAKIPKASVITDPWLELHGLGYEIDAIYMYYHVYMLFPSMKYIPMNFNREKRWRSHVYEK